MKKSRDIISENERPKAMSLEELIELKKAQIANLRKSIDELTRRENRLKADLDLIQSLTTTIVTHIQQNEQA